MLGNGDRLYVLFQIVNVLLNQARVVVIGTGTGVRVGDSDSAEAEADATPAPLLIARYPAKSFEEPCRISKA
jgi:hypothetical protein